MHEAYGRVKRGTHMPCTPAAARGPSPHKRKQRCMARRRRVQPIHRLPAWSGRRQAWPGLHQVQVRPRQRLSLFCCARGIANSKHATLALGCMHADACTTCPALPCRTHHSTPDSPSASTRAPPSRQWRASRRLRSFCRRPSRRPTLAHTQRPPVKRSEQHVPVGCGGRRGRRGPRGHAAPPPGFVAGGT